ncbi:MAG: AAA family ATPase [Dehalococcoidia bacterium]|nr:AAA family ATPase [Dehalococcoidia bacterium]
MDLVDVAGTNWSDTWHEAAATAFNDVLGGGKTGRYPASASTAVQVRAPKLSDEGAPFAALIHPENASSGGYAGMSLVVFPSATARPAMIAMVVGTLGLGPDAPILGRPGHGRRLAALTRWLNAEFGAGEMIAWAKSDPAAIEVDLPDEIRKRFPQFQSALSKYGRVTYALCVPPDRPDAIRTVVHAFLDVAMDARGIRPLSAHLPEADRLLGTYLGRLMPDLTAMDVGALLERRKYAVIEGPPGTGKTRLALEILHDVYHGRGATVQFHPGTTYETFVGGLMPVTSTQDAGLRFVPRGGYLMAAAEAAEACAPEPYLLHVDEINRADLSRVLGESIYLLESAAERARTVNLPYAFPSQDGRSERSTLTIPSNLHILGTMNSADRSIAILDVAIRRRFAFVRLWPQREVVRVNACGLMLTAFDRLIAIFIDWATEDAFALMPGHSYFLDDSEKTTPIALRQNLVPLLEEYLAQGYLPGFSEQIRAYIQWIESL